MPRRPLALTALIASVIGCAPAAKVASPPPSPEAVAAPVEATVEPAKQSIPRHLPQPVAAREPSAKPDIAMGEIAAAVDRAYSAGIAWSLANQRHNGNWGSFESPRSYEIYLDTQASHAAFQTATTALVTWGMMAPAHSDVRCAQARDRGLDVLESRDSPGRATGKTFYDVWAHTYLIDLGAAIIQDPSLAARHERWRGILTHEIARVRREQGAEGGWGYYDFNFAGLHPSGEQSTRFNTAAMILALNAGKGVGETIPPGTIEDAARAVLRMQLPSGAFAYGTYAQLTPRADYNKLSGSNGRLQVCNLALHSLGLGKVTEAVLLAGMQHLRNTHHDLEIGRGRVRPHESYYKDSGYYYYFGHYYAARVLAACAPSPERDELARWLAEVMVHDQNPDGSWFDYPLYGYGKAYATGYGLLTLEVLKPLLPSGAGG